MAEDPIVRLHDNGFHLQRLIDSEYHGAHNDPAAWNAGRDELIIRWWRMTNEWAFSAETTLSAESDLTAVARFHDAPRSSTAPPGANEEWAAIHDFLGVRLRALRDIIDSRRRGAPTINISNIGGSAGVINFGTILGDARGSVTQLQQSGQDALARLLGQVIEKLPGTRLSDPEKDDAAHLTKALADEASKPGKLSALGRAAGQTLGAILTRSAELAQIWEAIKPYVL